MTTAYILKDVPALSIAGTKKWWPRKALKQFATAHLLLTSGEIETTFARMADAVAETRKLIPTHIFDHPEFHEIGTRMLACWDDGISRLS